ncbi:MAG: hypothetical protein ABSF80_08430 [Chitinispirillaceae bacterium]|jgi:hypothetical protein
MNILPLIVLFLALVKLDQGQGAVNSGKGATNRAPAVAVTDSPAHQDTTSGPARGQAHTTVEITAWPGERFVVLEKPALYCAYGYELYSCPALDGCADAVDTALFTKYHRARCDRFSGHALLARTVEKRGKEHLVAFFDSVSGRTVYAKTSEGVCHELAYEKDLQAALKRWTGKTVFSARGFITSFSDGRTASIKVDLRDSLRVIGVQFGLTPLPAKPFWLMVETKAGDKGTIPLCFSWTNVKKDLRHGGNPWDDDLFETNPGQACTADAATWETINAHHVSLGMTRDQVRLSWGRPSAQKKAAYKGSARECWTYEKQNLYFDEKELIGIEEK